MVAADILIDLQGISFSYRPGKTVLNSLDFQLREGQKIGLIGPNGSGKTTIFHIIMGLLEPESGHIRIFGQEMKREKDFRSIRQKIGLLFQDSDDQLFCPTVLEDVAFGPLNQGKTIKEAKQIAEDILDSLGLTGFENRITYQLSGGEKRLVALATVLAMKPKVLLLDEPTNGLDNETTEKIIDILKGVDLSYIFISHNLDFIANTTDSIYGIVDGRISRETEKIPHAHMHSHSYGKLPHSHSNGD
jgi:cobalt/nickel transport system ATP-binding protein